MELTLLFAPHLHGALGWWDEIINLIPVVVGIVLVLYLYRNSRRRRDAEAEAPAPLAPGTHESSETAGQPPETAPADRRG
jgi:hypothetical protein